MAGIRDASGERERFERFAAVAEPELRRAAVAWYGVDVGADVTADALEYAWQHWADVELMANPVGYLFRVAQSRSRRYRRRPVCMPAIPTAEIPDIDPRLPPALEALTPRQRTAVLLVHAFGWTYAEASDAIGCSVSTLRNHLDRGMRRLRNEIGDGSA